jgi:hypothetical protein
MSNKNDVRRLLSIHKHRLQKLREQQALFGVSVDPRIIIEIEDIGKEIKELQLGVTNSSDSTSKHTGLKDITNYIDVVVKSEIFGTRSLLRVSKDMKVKAFVKFAIKTLGLPIKTKVEKLMISFQYDYSVKLNDITLPLNLNLQKCGVVDSSELQLSVGVNLVDDQGRIVKVLEAPCFR